MNDEELKTPEEIARENTIFIIVVICVILFGIYVSKLSRDRINAARIYNKTTEEKTNTASETQIIEKDKNKTENKSLQTSSSKKNKINKDNISKKSKRNKKRSYL